MSNGASFIKSEIVEGHKVHFTFLKINDKITLVAEKWVVMGEFYFCGCSSPFNKLGYNGENDIFF